MSRIEGADKGDWFKLIRDPLFYEAFNFDYDYIIKKFDLVNLKKENFFDHVWIFGVDPLNAYETMMVGSNPYWINGSPLKKDCKNFMIAGFALARRDSALHALGHALENLISFGFIGSFNQDRENNDNTVEDYNKLNYWDKFTLINIKSKKENAGVGNVHFPFNGIKDNYYENKDLFILIGKVGWIIPILMEKTLSNNKAWMELHTNAGILNDPWWKSWPDRLYVRFWMYLFPHIDGYTETGQLNNWWSYYSNLDYAARIDSNNTAIIEYVGKEVILSYNVYYCSGDIEKVSKAKKDKNVHINGNCVEFNNNNNQLIGAKKGTCSVSKFRDGKDVTLEINILTATSFNIRKFMSFED